MQKYITLDKMSKKQKKEFNTMRRGTWGEFNPVTRKPANPKAYNRAKEKQNSYKEY